MYLAVACVVFGGVCFVLFFSFQEMSWIKYGTELSQLLKVLPTYSFKLKKILTQCPYSLTFKKGNPRSYFYDLEVIISQYMFMAFGILCPNKICTPLSVTCFENKLAQIHRMCRTPDLGTNLTWYPAQR